MDAHDILAMNVYLACEQSFTPVLNIPSNAQGTLAEKVIASNRGYSGSRNLRIV